MRHWLLLLAAVVVGCVAAIALDYTPLAALGALILVSLGGALGIVILAIVALLLRGLLTRGRRSRGERSN